MLMIGGSLFAAIAAFAFKPASPSKNEFDVTRYKNITDCPSVLCKANGTTTCNGFFENPNCTSAISDGLNYTP